MYNFPVNHNFFRIYNLKIPTLRLKMHTLEFPKGGPGPSVGEKRCRSLHSGPCPFLKKMEAKWAYMGIVLIKIVKNHGYFVNIPQFIASKYRKIIPWILQMLLILQMMLLQSLDLLFLFFQCRTFSKQIKLALHDVINNVIIECGVKIHYKYENNYSLLA